MRARVMIFGFVLLIATLPASAAEPAASTPATPCTIKTRNDRIVIMVCPQGLGRTEWQNAGKSACDATKRCRVWIWDDAGKAPDAAPASDEALSQKLAFAAVAVWVNDSESLILLSYGRE